MPSIWLPWARPAAPCAAPAARRSGWRGRRMRSRSPRRRRRWLPPASRPAAATPPPNGTRWRARTRAGTGHPGRRQPLDCGRLAGRGATPARPIGRLAAMPRRCRSRTPRAAAAWFAKLFATAGAVPRIRQALRQPADRLRRHGRAGAGADDLARRRGAAAAADRGFLQDGRARRESARARVQGRQDHHRDRGRQAGAGDRGRDRRRNQKAGRTAAAALFASATRRARRSTPGTRCWSRPC